jgi:hypothetical protein
MLPPTKKRIIVFSILAIIAVGAGFGYYLYNKGPRDVKNASGIKVAATELYQTFAKDSMVAGKKYKDRILEVSGMVSKVSKNQENKDILFLKTNENGAFINCTLEGPANNIGENENVIIKGICNGIGMGDADLGILGDVYLVRCYISK